MLKASEILCRVICKDSALMKALKPSLQKGDPYVQAERIRKLCVELVGPESSLVRTRSEILEVLIANVSWPDVLMQLQQQQAHESTLEPEKIVEPRGAQVSPPPAKEKKKKVIYL